MKLIAVAQKLPSLAVGSRGSTRSRLAVAGAGSRLAVAGAATARTGIWQMPHASLGHRFGYSFN